LALGGVVLLTQPWQGDFNLVGVAWAALAAIGWGVYILLTQRIGDRFSGIGALTLTVPIAAVAAAVVGIPQASGHLSLDILAAAAGLAILLPVLPFALEMLALRKMTPTAFGTLMALEPAVGVLLGLLILHQQPSPIQVVGILLVVLAGAAAQRGGRRTPAKEQSGSPADLDFVG
jgi:inner membrane transporter RhtA